jgi:hypothetical protein
MCKGALLECLDLGDVYMFHFEEEVGDIEMNIVRIGTDCDTIDKKTGAHGGLAYIPPDFTKGKKINIRSLVI